MMEDVEIKSTCQVYWVVPGTSTIKGIVFQCDFIVKLFKLAKRFEGLCVVVRRWVQMCLRL